jgi:hypothetical protein
MPLSPPPAFHLRRHTIQTPPRNTPHTIDDAFHALGELQDSYDDLARLLTFYIPSRGCVTFTEDEIEVAVVFDSALQSPDYFAFVILDWDSTVWVTDRAVTGFTVHTGTGAPAEGGVARWHLVAGGPMRDDCGDTDEIVTPIVTIVATIPDAEKLPLVEGEFTVTRTGPTDDALTVFYTVSGDAVAGTDYDALSGSVVILAGDASAVIPVVPIP